MRRSFSIVAIGLVAVVMAPLSTAWSEDGTSAQDNEIFAAEAESSAIQFVHHFPMLVDPSIGYALSQTNQTPTATGKASVVEPGLVGRVALYTYGKRRDKDGSIQPGLIEVPLSSECAYPDPPGCGSAASPLNRAERLKPIRADTVTLGAQVVFYALAAALPDHRSLRAARGQPARLEDHPGCGEPAGRRLGVFASLGNHA